MRFEGVRKWVGFFVILGVLRYKQISFVENNSGSPTKIILKDKFMIINILAWVLSFIYLIYFNL